MAKKSKRGGARPGSGQPMVGEEPTQQISVTVPGEVLRALNEYSRANDRKRSSVVADLVRRALRRRGYDC